MRLFCVNFLPVKQEILADKSEFAKKTVLFKKEVDFVANLINQKMLTARNVQF